ncbi:heparinase II/III family protein [Fulvivirgaceae bacterium BMA10]|uniref:Heparinase II/III family protein n=1 Tax=Splendidivirga corallicola TaxID=3051826 RepID=A0ABT8KRL0_9BACT|nr:heparinase II/III family protein [Fulvivirgaceae bacterium BMA10]
MKNIVGTEQRMKQGIYIIIVFFLMAVDQSQAGEKRDLLQERSNNSSFSTWILPNKSWITFPAYSDREAWNKIPSNVRMSFIDEGEKYLDFSWPSIPASTYLDFVRTGSREVMQQPYRKRKKAMEALVMAELMEGKGRFLDQVVNGVWAYCEQTYWGLSAHLTMQRNGAGLPDANDPTIDLGVGMISADLAWIHHFFRKEFDDINPLISQRIKKEITDKVLTPFYTRNDFWWMGFNSDFVNNWNPWCNYNVLTCIMLIEDDRDKQLAGIRKVMKSVDQFINYYPDDGGCEEGPGYWGHAGGKLFDVLELLYKISGGNITLYDHELIRNIGTYIYKAYIAHPYFINFADAGARIHTRPGMIYRYGKRIKDVNMMGFGAFLAGKYGWKEGEISEGKIEITLHNIFILDDILKHEPIEPLSNHFWLPDTQIMGARDNAGTTDGFYFAAKGGYNAESHNHNDAGTFVLYYDGKPCIVDAGVGTYTKKTFSNERYDIWTMQSQYHNLPKINGEDQRFGKQYKATNCKFSASPSNIRFSTELATAYPEEAKVKSWIRSYQLKRGKYFKISDKYQLLAKSGETTFNFLTSCKADISIPGKVGLKGEGFSLWLHYESSKIEVSEEVIEISDSKLKKSWPQGLTRLVFSLKNDRLSGENTFIITK